MEDIIYERVKPLVDRVARTVSSHFPKYITAEDTAQAIWIWVYENLNTVVKIIDDGEAWEAKLRPLMNRAANTFARAEDASVNGYSPEDMFTYSTSVIEALLPDVLDYTDWQSFSTFGDAQPKAAPTKESYGDRVTMLADIKSALPALTMRQKEAVWHVYGLGMTQEAAGEALGVSQGAIQARLSASVKAVQKALGYTDWSERREAADSGSRRFRNAEANAYSERIYEG